ncbi:MAG: YbhB/YbcL family Raf kinase inhibitor-like protein [Dehalococcoidia bacterium]|nr:YbhB/YbcL family Raf kinase inhibitor-like protein [Dehalococcoidia bacterium]
MIVRWTWAVVVPVLLLAACGGDNGARGGPPSGTASPSPQVHVLAVVSPAFAEGGQIPVKFSCDGAEAPIPLSWSGEPGNTESFALILDDPDAPGDEPFVHWVMYDIPPNNTGFESVSKDGRLPNGAAQGTNSRGEIGYAGPCPPGGQTHTYVMTVYALHAALGLEPGASRGEVEAAMQGHVLAAGEITGTFSR